MQNPAAFPPFRPHSELEKFPLEERILVALAGQTWASAPDLANGLDQSEIYKAFRKLEKDKLIAGRDLGVTRRIQRRYVPTRQGVMHLTKPFQYEGLLRAALPLTWQMTEAGATKTLEWIPMIESLYEILPTFWTGGLASPFEWQSPYSDPSCSSHIWLGKPTLTQVLWLPRGRLHVVATWRFERYDKRPRYYSIPFFWAGLLPQEDYRSRSLRLGSTFIRCPRDPGGRIWWNIDPPVVALGLDEFSAFRARRAYGDDVQVASVDTGGTLVWSAEASHSEWTLGENPPQARSIGNPEAAAIGEGPDLANLMGIREDRILGFLADFRAATRANLMRAFRMSGSSATTALNHLEDLGLLVASSEKNLYVTERCVQMLAARDRVDVGRLVEVTYLDPEGEAAIRERDHDSAVAEVAAWLRGAGMQVAAGWRWVVSWDDGQLVPDLWVLLMVPGREEGIWIPIEVEFSAKSKKRIEEKLRSYRLAPIRLNQTFPILVITGEAMPAKRFDDQAGDLPILTTTLKEFRTGVWEGPESVWRRKGRPVGLSSLAEEYYGHLRQETGRELDYSTPSLEVWDKLIGKESIWSDFQTAGIDDDIDLEWPSIDPPPISPTPPSAPVGKASTAQEKVLDEARAEPSANNPVSTPLPPTPPPVPVGKAATPQDWGRQRSHVLSRVDSLVARADSRAYISLKQGKLTEEERLCLHRVRAIITYGANRHFQAEDILVEKWLQICLRLKDMHLRAIRSRNILWWLTASRAKTDPCRKFRDLLEDYPNTRRDACKKFDGWFKMVNHADRAARKARTLE